MAGIGTLAAGQWEEIVATSPDVQTGGTRGVFSGGFTPGSSPGNQDVMDYINIATTGDAIDFGDLSAARSALGATSDRTRGLVLGGYTPSNTDTIEFFTFASTGSRADFEDLTFARRYPTGSSNGTRGLIAGGYTSNYVEEIEYVTIQSAAEAVDFGNLATDESGWVVIIQELKILSIMLSLHLLEMQ
jgi:hypothetical protein